MYLGVKGTIHLKAFQREIETYQALAQKDKPVFTILGYLKLALVVLLLFLFYRIFLVGYSAARLAFIIVVFAVLAALWVVHILVGNRIKMHETMVRINREYVARYTGAWHELPDGSDLIAQADYSGPLFHLDLLGKDSLFQLLNISKTWYGRVRFKSDLLSQRYSAEEIRRRQEAVRELTEDHPYRCRWQYELYSLDEKKDITGFVAELTDKDTRLRRPPALLLVILSAVAILAATVGIITSIGPFLYVGLSLFALQGIMWVVGYLTNSRYLKVLAKAPYAFEPYSRAIKLLGSQKYHSPSLQGLQSMLCRGDTSAGAAFKKLDALASCCKLIHNPILYFAFNILFSWDLHCAYALARWREKYGTLCGGWLEAVGDYESLLSLSVMPAVVEHTSLPEITDEANHFSAAEIGHPLIKNDDRKCNDMEMSGRVVILTGSNMSGKTTFLRTLGVNLVLAGCGGYVCAGRMSTSVFRVATSIRNLDSVNDGVSTFYAELLSIKAIIDLAARNAGVFFLIDEIFGGTNSEDRRTGADLVIGDLVRHKAMGVITTHDLAICAAADAYREAINYYFSDQIAEGQMLFDYAIKRGIAPTTNARTLMALLGIGGQDASGGSISGR